MPMVLPANYLAAPATGSKAVFPTTTPTMDGIYTDSLILLPSMPVLQPTMVMVPMAMAMALNWAAPAKVFLTQLPIAQPAITKHGVTMATVIQDILLSPEAVV